MTYCALSATRLSEQFHLVFRRMNLQQISLVSAAVQASSALRILYQAVFRLLNLKRIHEVCRRDVSGIEQKMVTRNTEHRLGKLLYFGQKEVLDILTAEYKRGLLFTHTLHAVSDIFYRCHIC